jgi:menaquinol-cytochrome c reductase iron-sulfur subunit
MEEKTRRSFFGTLVGAISVVVGAIMAVPLLRFVWYPVSHRGGEADWFAVGNAASFAGHEPIRAEVEVRKQDGWRVSRSKQTVWITRDANGALRVLSAICTHLGCVVPWKPELKQFACPCHRAFYAPDGSRISGPQPRGLDPLPTKIENGTLYVRYLYFRQLVAKREVIG